MKNFKLRANIGMRILKALPRHAIESMGADEIEQFKFNVDNLLTEYATPPSDKVTVTDEFQIFMNEVHEWADRAFGTERTAIAPLYHLEKEVDEAIKAMKQGIRPNTLTELADCFILILNASSKYRVTFDELFKAAKDKMEINKSRKWGKPDKNGVHEHIK